MNRRIAVVFGLIALGVLLFWGGALFAQSQGRAAGWMMGPTSAARPGPGLMDGWNGVMNGGMIDSTMMGSGYTGSDMMGGSMMNGNVMGPAMMGGMMAGNMMGSSIMGGFSGLASVDPISAEAATAAVDNYLTTLDNDALAPGEIMIFDNHAYAQIVDEETGQGAFELLIDPVTGNVFPELGPNMMWNSEYGMAAGTAGLGMMGGGMMGGFGYAPDGERQLAAEDAVTIAQEFLDARLPSRSADEHADAFPGYYTLHVLEDGEIVGMLSVHAGSGQVFLHHWHGEFIEMAGPDHE